MYLVFFSVTGKDYFLVPWKVRIDLTAFLLVPNVSKKLYRYCVMGQQKPLFTYLFLPCLALIASVERKIALSLTSVYTICNSVFAYLSKCLNDLLIKSDTVVFDYSHMFYSLCHQCFKYLKLQQPFQVLYKIVFFVCIEVMNRR